MNLIPKQYDQLSDVFKEASAVILGGLIIGTILSERPNYVLVLAIYFKRLGE